MGCSLALPNEPTVPKSDSRGKLVRYRDHGSPKSDNDEKIRKLAGHILKVICYIDQHKWDQANDALNAEKVAESCGFRIESQIKVFSDLDEAIGYTRGRAMWFKNQMKVRLPQVAIGEKGTSEDAWKFPFQIPELANRFYPIWLEEWIHAFQFFVARPICDKTVEFTKSPQFKDSWDIYEIDVFAIYRDLGWCEEMLNEMESRYDERIAFAHFSKKGDTQNINRMMIFCRKLKSK